MKDEKNFKMQRLFALVISIIFISPVFFVEEEISMKIIYIFLAGAIGWTIGKRIIACPNKEGKIKKNPILLSNGVLFIYLVIYISAVFLLDQELFKTNLLLFILKILLGGVVFFYGGLKGIQNKEIFLRGGHLYGKSAIIFGLLGVLFSLFILFYKYIISITR